MENTKRTVTCGELTKADVGKKVVLNGWEAAPVTWVALYSFASVTATESHR